MLEERNFNPESRILHDLWRRETGTLPAGRAYRLVELDSKDHGWLTLAVEPHDPEEVVLYRYEDRRRVSDTWMRFEALTDYGPGHADRAFEPFAVDPDTLDDDEATGAAWGCPRGPSTRTARAGRRGRGCRAPRSTSPSTGTATSARARPS